MDLKRKDTPENQEFWEYVERAKKDWERVKPEWARKLESQSSDGFKKKSE